LSGSDASTNVVFDEVRFTADVLKTNEFLELPATHFTACNPRPNSGDLAVRAATRPKQQYSIDMCTNPVAGGVWANLGGVNAYATNFYSDFEIPKPLVLPNVIYRIRR